MKRLVVFVFFIFFSLSAYNQIIKGTVFNKKDKKPVHLASIYFNGTVVGTNSDENGRFELDVSKYPSMPLTVSALGYNTLTLSDFSIEDEMVIYLTSRVFELKEVVVSGKALVWARKANLRLFRQSFLGTTPNALKSRILNEEDIHFIYDQSDTLKAYTSKPLIIENNALGYIITYFLEEFQRDKTNDIFFFNGNILFKEQIKTDTALNIRYERKRKSVYVGSKMQFFRALWNNDLKSASFVIKDTYNKILDYSDIVTVDEGGNKYLKYNGKLFIYHHSTNPVGYITLLTDNVYFDKTGFFDPMNIVWGGLMAKQLIADWLPYDYMPPGE